MLKSSGGEQRLGVNKLSEGKREDKAHKAQGSQGRCLGMEATDSKHCKTTC